MPYANSKGADQPVRTHSLISAFVIRCLGTVFPLVSIDTIARLQLAFVAEQSCLSLIWSQTSEDRFSRDVVHIRI